MSSMEILERELEAEMPEQYSYDELKTITADFAHKIGAGGFSEVYRGQFSDGVEVAVKVLKINEVVEETFEAEIMTVGTIYHRNLVKLYGFCSEDNIKALVYEFMENGSLDSILYDKSSIIEWHKFYHIAVEIAKALAYLHHGCHVQIIHRDVKPFNVLLDANYSAKLTDFGLADLMDGNQTDSMVKGTAGYIAPEACLQDFVITFKCDVYSFGMLLFEILSRIPVFKGGNFPKKVWDGFEKKELDQIIADCGIREEDSKRATILAMVALWCVQITPETRPSMSTVVTVLEQEMQVNAPPNPFTFSDPTLSMHPDMNYAYPSSSDQSVPTHMNFNSIEEQVTEIVTDNDGRKGDGNERKVDKFVAYVEKKRLVTNEVCGSILAKMEELQINCDTFEEERKLDETRTYVEMKRSVTNELCESILKIMKEV